jgi:aspartate-semialdehyde dehydrogenase
LSAIAILHPSGLLGKELRETLDARHPEWSDIRLLSSHEDEIGTLTEVAGAAALVGRFEPERLEDVSVAFFCGEMAANRPLLAELPPETTAIVLSYDATVEDGLPIVAGVNTADAHGGRVLLSPHPGVVLLAHLLHPLRQLALVESIATLIQPASMRENAGLEELFEQTRQIVAMTRRGPSPVFGAQLAFNVLPAPLPADPIAAQLRSVLAGAPPPALQILQGAVFHSVAASVYVRGAEPLGLQAIRKAFAGHPFLELADKPRHLGPIDAAASEKVILGTPRKDEATGGFWLWAVMDNLTRGGALNAIEIAEAVVS